MKTTYKETRHLASYKLRELCVWKGWYTAGSNEEYGHLLFDLADCKENLSTEDVIEIAKDIYEHTAPRDLHDYGIADIAAEVNRACTVVFVAA